MKLVFYNKTLISGGIEKCIEVLSKYLYKMYEIEVVYTEDSILDYNIVNNIKKYAKVYKIEDGMSVDCDFCIWCSLYFDYDKLKKIIRSRHYIAWIHSMPRILPDCLLDNQQFILDCNEIVCVSNAVKNNLNISKPGIIIHNFIDLEIKELAETFNPFKEVPNDFLLLSVVSRLSNGKGFDRLLLLCKSLHEKQINFKVNIIGKGRKTEQVIRNDFSPFKEVEFYGYQDNPYPHVKNADYLVQLSDDESWCNSITESKILGTPVIVTNFDSSKEQIENEINGIVVDLNEKNYDDVINKVINLKDELHKNLSQFKYTNEIDEWIKILK